MGDIVAASVNRLRRKLRHFDGPADVWSFVSIGIALALIPFALRTFGVQRVISRLDSSPEARPPRGRPTTATASLRHAQRLALYADFWLRHLRLGNPCLRRSLVLFGRLRHAGLPVIFCLGIRKNQPPGTDDPFQGHAWLELDDHVLLEPEASAAEQVRTFRYPPNIRG